MSELDVQLAGKSLADYTNTQLRLALGAVLYTNTADMWRRYLNQLGYSGDVSQMLQKYYVEYSVPQNFRNYINAGAFIYSPQQLFTDGSKGVVYDNNDFVDSATWRRNLLTYSEQFNNAAWQNVSTGTVTVTANTVTAPDGTLTADTLTGSAANVPQLSYPLTLEAVAYTFSFYARADSNQTVDVREGGIQLGTAALTTSWQRFSFTWTPAAGFKQPGLRLSNNQVIYAWGAQLERASSASDYQRITDFNSDFLAAFPSTTLFLDSAGTTPATVNGLVGLQLDKSANLALGAEILVNNDFSNGSTGWAVTGNDATHVVTFSGGSVRYQSDTTTPVLQLSQAFSPTVSAWYLVEIVVSNYVSGSLKFDSDFGDVAVPATVGTHRFYCKRDSGGFSLYRNSASVDITIDSVSIKRLSGNHRYQTTTGSKPVLRGTPVGSSLVTNGDFASDVSGWTAASGGSISWASGKMRVTNGGGGRGTGEQAFTTVVGKVYRVRFSATAGTAASAFFGVAQGSGPASFIAGVSNSLGTDFYFTAVGTTTYVYAQPNITTAGVYIDVDNIEIHDVSAGSVTAPYGLQYDGVDDFMQTASVDFTATDKMFVCAGVRKLSDAATALILELGANSSVASSSFGFQGPSVSGANKFNFNTSGTIVVVPAATTTTYNAPYLGVLTGVGNIAGDSAILRINGVEIQNLALDQGTGNYANAVLYFGRRGGTSIPYNGLDFGMVICGKTLTSNQISSTERYIAQRTGVTI